MRRRVSRGAARARGGLILHLIDEIRQCREDILVRPMLLYHPGRDIGRPASRQHSFAVGAEMPQLAVQEADGELRVLAQRPDDLVHRAAVAR